MDYGDKDEKNTWDLMTYNYVKYAPTQVSAPTSAAAATAAYAPGPGPGPLPYWGKASRKLDGLGPIGNRPSTYKLHQFVPKADWLNQSMNESVTRQFIEQPWLHRVC